MKIRKAVFPVAGLGTRFLPATKAVPKGMLPLVDKPVIQYVVEEAAESGVGFFLFVTGGADQSIENHFETSFELEAALSKAGKTELLEKIQRLNQLGKFVYIKQQQPPRGLGHAILMAEPIVEDDYFAAFLPDDVILSQTPCLKQAIDVHERYGGGVITVSRTDALGQERYGILEVEKTDDPRVHKIVDIIEKPGAKNAPSDLAVMGRYILPKEIFAQLKVTPPGAGNEIQLTDAIRAILKKKDFYACEFEGERLDCGETMGYLKASARVGLERKDVAGEFREYLKSILE